MRVVFMGTPDFAVPVLGVLIDDYDVVAVYTQPPRPAGRGHREQATPVHRAAEAAGVPVRYPRSLKSDVAQAEFAACSADVAVVAAYGLILPSSVLHAPRYGCVNVHASLLPRWRGAAPIQRAILAGDTQTGICLMQMDEGLDTGPVYACKRTPIDERTTAGALHDRLAELGSVMVRQYLPKILGGEIVAAPQPSDGVTYADKIAKSEAQINWDRPAGRVVRHINGFSPYPGAWAEHEGTRFKILAAEAVPGSGAPGQILNDALVIACGEGAIRVETIQMAGRQPLTAAQLLLGHRMPAGTFFH